MFRHDACGAHVLPKSDGLLLRWDRQNTVLLCAQDHFQWAHLHPAESRQWFQSKFPERFAHLQECRRRHAKFDEGTRRMLIAALEQELRRLGGWP